MESAAADQDDKLIRASCTLAKAWEKFQKQLPSSQANDLRGQPPRLSVLFQAVKDADLHFKKKRDETKWGKVKGAFARVTKSAEDHSQLLAFVPSNDKYICLVTGTLSTIVKASINHEQLADGVATSLEQLCEDVAHWKKQILAHPRVPEMQNAIKALYVVIFEFLTDLFTDWCSSGRRRFLKSFDQNAFDKLFESKQTQIRRLTEKLDRAATVDTQRTIQLMEEKVGALPLVTEAVLESWLLKLGSRFQKLLEDQRPRDADSHPDATNMLETRVPRQIELHPEDTDSIVDFGVQSYNRDDLLATIPSRKTILEPLLQDIKRLADGRPSLYIDRRVVLELRGWISGSKGDNLWVQGPAHVPRPSQNTLTAVSVIASAMDAQLPIVFYLSTTSMGMHPPAQSVRRMISLLILQMLALLPDEVTTRRDLSSATVEAHMTDSADVKQSLNLLRDLMTFAPRPVLCVVDGAQMLEDLSDGDHTADLTDTLTFLCDGGEDAEIRGSQFKLLITTDGYMDALALQVGSGNMRSIQYEVEADERWADDTLHFGQLDINYD